MFLKGREWISWSMIAFCARPQGEARTSTKVSILGGCDTRSEVSTEAMRDGSTARAANLSIRGF